MGTCTALCKVKRKSHLTMDLEVSRIVGGLSVMAEFLCHLLACAIGQCVESKPHSVGIYLFIYFLNFLFMGVVDFDLDGKWCVLGNQQIVFQRLFVMGCIKTYSLCCF